MGLRVIIGNSRPWSDPDRVRAAMGECMAAAADRAPVGEFPRLTVVHGHDRHGADPVVDRWVWQMHRTTRLVARPERYPADWNGPCRPSCQTGHRRRHEGGFTTCPAAAYYRDAEMISRGADIAIVFIHGDDRPALRFFDKVVSAGIDVVRFIE